MWHLIQHWLAYMTGSLNTSGAPPNYNWWSGAGSDLGELAVFGAVVGGWHRVNCHVRHCWRIGRHTTDGGHTVCRRHMPGGAPTYDDVIKAHRDARRGRRRQDHEASGERMHRKEDAPGSASPEQVRAQNSAAEITDTQTREGKP